MPKVPSITVHDGPAAPIGRFALKGKRAELRNILMNLKRNQYADLRDFSRSYVYGVAKQLDIRITTRKMENGTARVWRRFEEK